MDITVPLEHNPPGRPPAVPKATRYRAETAVIDIADAERVLARRWTLHVHRRSGKHYAKEAGLNGIMLHRFILGLPRTPGLDDKVDHKDGDGLNCRRSNLRIVTNTQNVVNSAGRGGSSRFKGVQKEKRPGRGKWRWTISGSCPTEEEAARMYDLLARTAWGEHAWLNDV
jgi:hypothetical protein